MHSQPSRFNGFLPPVLFLTCDICGHFIDIRFRHREGAVSSGPQKFTVIKSFALIQWDELPLSSRATSLIERPVGRSTSV